MTQTATATQHGSAWMHYRVDVIHVPISEPYLSFFSCTAGSDESTRSVGGMSTEEEPMSDELAHSGLLLAPGFLGLAYVLATLPEVGDPVTTPITGAWKFGLIATHVLIFVLVPVGMRVFHEALPALNVKRSGASSNHQKTNTCLPNTLYPTIGNLWDLAYNVHP